MSGERETIATTRGAGREILLSFLRFVAISIALYIPYDRFVAPYYSRLVALIARPFLALFGVPLLMEQALRITEDISLNPLVYLSLVIAVGRIPWRAKPKPAGLGVAILTVANAFTVFLAFMSAHRNSERMWAETEFLSLTMNFFVPLLLWLVLLPIRSVFPLFGNSDR